MTDRGPSTVPLRIRLPYGSEEEFVERYGGNVSRGGMFIATRALKPEGTEVEFELVLAGGERLFRGEGVVVKALVDAGGGRSGMTVRFKRLDERGRALVERILERRRAGPPETAGKNGVAPEPTPPKAKPNPQDLVLGIDLGSTNARCAVVIDGAPRLVPLGDGGAKTSMPSSATVDDEGRLVAGAGDPERTLWEVKRLLGRRARARQVREWARRFDLPVVQDENGDAAVEIDGRTRALPDAAAAILRALKQAAQAHLGCPVPRAVVCVPAPFGDRQRAALVRAAGLAGLEVLRVVNEPSAVALAHAHGRGWARKRVLVYDFGGGTFDAAVVQITGDELEVIACAGDTSLGGMDLDERVADEIRRQLRAQTSAVDEPPMAPRLRAAAERAKITLGTDERAEVQVHLESMFEDPREVDVRTELRRETLERLTGDLVDRTFQLCSGVLGAAGLTPEQLDEVVMAGGQSLSPLVRRRAEAEFGRAPRAEVDPQAAAALGAAILGHAMVRPEQGHTVALVEVLSRPIGIAQRDGAFRRALERGTPLPAVKTIMLPVTPGEALGIAVFQGDSDRADENDFVGSLRLTARHAGEAALRFRAAADGTFQISVQLPGSEVDVPLETAGVSEVTRADLVARAPLPPAPVGGPARPGLLGGIRRLFGR